MRVNLDRAKTKEEEAEGPKTGGRKEGRRAKKKPPTGTRKQV